MSRIMANTYSQIYIHIVFTVEGRQNLIRKQYKEELHKYITGIIQNKGQKVITINSMPDHVHILIGMKPNVVLSDLVRDIKANSSKIYNSAVLINRSGEIILKHRKIQEPPPFERGKTVKSVETELGRLTMIICGDIFNEEVIRKVDRTTDLLILLTGGFYAGKFADYNKGYSEDREAYLDAVKKIGVSTAIVSTLEPTLESEKVYFGIGMVVDDKGNSVKESSHKADEFLVFDI